MYVRIIIQRTDNNSNQRQGFFQAMAELKAKRELSSHEEAHYGDIYKWFQKNLRRPRSFTRSSKPHAKKVAISWFKESATDHIDKMREVAAILGGHGIHTEMIVSSRPGYIVYEDAYQIAAEPYADTRT
jgi:hypothetical protein